MIALFYLYHWLIISPLKKIYIPIVLLGIYSIVVTSEAQLSLFSRANGQIRDNSGSIPVLSTPSILAVLTGTSVSEITITDNVMSAESSVYLDGDEYIPETSAIETYTVQSGDTIASIATKFKISANTIRWANKLGGKKSITVGQELLILPVTGVKHTVVRGDTINSLAKKYKADAEEIADFNGIETSDKLSLGDTVIIPDGNGELAQEKTTLKKTPSKNGGKLVNDLANRAGNGYFIRPVALNGGNIRKTQGFHGPYNAVDIGAPIGTPIVAAADGVVITAKPKGWNGGYGGLTIIRHNNGSQSLYGHQSTIYVTAGQTVNQGDIIGRTGNTGRSTGPHLHLEFRGIKTPILY